MYIYSMSVTTSNCNLNSLVFDLTLFIHEFALLILFSDIGFLVVSWRLVIEGLLKIRVCQVWWQINTTKLVSL